MMRPSGQLRGFTLAELMMGMGIMAILIGALAGIVRAVADGWSSTENVQAIQVAARQGGMQLYRMLSGAKFVGLAVDDDWTINSSGVKVASGGAAAQLMYWKHDNTMEYGKIQAEELALIEHDRANKRLVLYELSPTASSLVRKTAYTGTAITHSPDAATFKALPGITSRALATGVTQVSFEAIYKGSTSQRQMVEFVLTFERGGQVRTEYGTVVLRGPVTPVN